MTILDLTPYMIDPYGLLSALTKRKQARLSGQVIVGSYVRRLG